MKHPFKLRRPRHTVFEDDEGPDQPASHPAEDYSPPPALRAVRALTLWGALAAGVAGGYGLLWFGLAWSFREGALAFVAAERDKGRTVEHGEIVVGGFPLDLRLTVPGPRYAAAGVGVEADRAVFTAKPWSPGTVRVSLDAPLAVTGKGAAFHGQARRLEGVFSFSSKGAPELLGADVEGLSVADVAGRTVLALKNGAFRFEAGSGGYGVALRAEGFRLTPAPGFPLVLPFTPPLGDELAFFDLRAAMKMPLGPGALAQSLAGWRDGGGTVEVSHLAAAYGPLVVRASGTLSLDPALQPIGSFTAAAEGFFGFIDGLEQRGMVRGRDAIAAKIVLGALMKKGDDGRPSINMAVTVHDRVFYAGPAPLWRFPAVDWSGLGPAPEPMPASPAEPASGSESKSKSGSKPELPPDFEVRPPPAHLPKPTGAPVLRK